MKIEGRKVCYVILQMGKLGNTLTKYILNLPRNLEMLDLVCVLTDSLLLTSHQHIILFGQ